MSGHSKWAGIKHKKAANDAKRGNLFTRIANNVTIAAKQGGGDISMNPSLRLAVETARGANMPKDNIERAIKRGTGELGGQAVEQLLYEGFGPGNIAMLVEALSDNRNRTNSDVRLIMSKNGGRIADGGVAYQFSQKGVIRVEVPASKEEAFEEAVIESGADDYSVVEGEGTVYTQVAQLHAVSSQIEKGCKVLSASIEYVANAPTETDDETLEKVARLLEALEDHDDVTNVYTNLAE
jgi:YebC/PmpR family DNA-binding regulatory protein